MKNIFATLGVFCLFFGLSAPITAQENGKTLVVYFSESGNTRNMANLIHEMTDSDIVEIEMLNPYPSNYSELLAQAEADLKANARPALRTHIENMEEYETVILGYPNWYALLPMPVFTFLESYDFSGKRILPFCSHGNGMLGESVSNICKTCPKAFVGEALSVTYGGGSTLRTEIKDWPNRHGLAK